MLRVKHMLRARAHLTRASSASVKGFTDYASEISVINKRFMHVDDTLKEEYAIILFIHMLLKDASRATCDSVQKCDSVKND